MRARILARKSKPGNRGGLHYSQFRRYLETRASQIQLLAFRPGRENRRPLSPIREVGLIAPACHKRYRTDSLPQDIATSRKKATGALGSGLRGGFTNCP